MLIAQTFCGEGGAAIEEGIEGEAEESGVECLRDVEQKRQQEVESPEKKKPESVDKSGEEAMGALLLSSELRITLGPSKTYTPYKCTRHDVR